MDAEPDAPTARADQVEPHESSEPPERLTPSRRMRVASGVMVLALASLAVSATLFLVPVTNPGVQSCGSPAWFLLQAETDASLAEPDGSPLHGWDHERITEAHENRCSKLVADRAVPAGVLLMSFWVFTLAGVATGWNGRRALRAAAEAEEVGESESVPPV